MSYFAIIEKIESTAILLLKIRGLSRVVIHIINHLNFWLNWAFKTGAGAPELDGASEAQNRSSFSIQIATDDKDRESLKESQN